MAKTKLRNPYKRKLAVLNDQLCYFLFADHQVGCVMSAAVQPNDRFVTDAFTGNPFAPRLRVQLGDLADFRAAAWKVNAGISLAFGIEQIFSYLKDVKELRQKITAQAGTAGADEVPEDRMLRNLQEWGRNPDPALFKTLKYLRLRRNHLMHMKKEINSEFKRVLSQESHCLRRFWANRPASFEALDFSSFKVDSFGVKESFVIAKILRICLVEIDALVAASIPHADLLKYEARQVLKRNPNLYSSAHILGTKIRNSVRDDYSVLFDRQEVEAVVASLVSRN